MLKESNNEMNGSSEKWSVKEANPSIEVSKVYL